MNAPFFVLAFWKKGAAFTAKTAASVLMVSLLARVHIAVLGKIQIDPLYAAFLGNLLAGVGLIILFRHKASLGGFNVLALLAQERLGWRAGYVQLALDTSIVLAAIGVVTPSRVALSVLGGAVLNISLATNHRPGRYVGY